MTPTGKRLRNGLEAIADQATPSDDAWGQIVRLLHDPEDTTVSDQVVPEETADNAKPTQAESSSRPESATLSRRLATAAAVAAAIVTLAGIARSISPDVRSVIADQAPGAELSAGSPQRAQTLVDLYVEAFNAGDGPGATGVFADGAMITDGHADGLRVHSAGTGRSEPAPAAFRLLAKDMTVAEWETYLTVHSYQRSRIEEVVCSEPAAAAPETLECRWRLHDPITTALDKPGRLIESSWRVGGGGLASVTFLTENDFDHGWAYFVFIEWLQTNHDSVDPPLPSFSEDPNLYALLGYTYGRQDRRNLSSDQLRLIGETVFRYVPAWNRQLQAGTAEIPDPCEQLGPVYPDRCD